MLVKAGIVSLFLVFVSKHSLAQTPGAKLKIENVEQTNIHDNDKGVGVSEHLVKGVVTDENKSPLPGVNIILKGSMIGMNRWGGKV